MCGMAIRSKWYHLSLCQIKNKGNHTKIGCPTLLATWHAKIGHPTCAIHQNNQLNKCVKMSHRASSQHHWQLNKTPLITQKEIKEPYGEVFEGIGCFPGKPYHINLDESVTPVQTRCRPVLVHLKEVFKQEINKMLDAGILKTSQKSNSLDQQLCPSWGQKPRWNHQTQNLFGSYQFEQDSHLWTLLQQDPRGHCTSFSKCKGYHCHRLF